MLDAYFWLYSLHFFLYTNYAGTIVASRLKSWKTLTLVTLTFDPKNTNEPFEMEIQVILINMPSSFAMKNVKIVSNTITW